MINLFTADAMIWGRSMWYGASGPMDDLIGDPWVKKQCLHIKTNADAIRKWEFNPFIHKKTAPKKFESEAFLMIKKLMML